ncbi:hypothetical protein LCGC14_1161920 [marine sediment metagenome]|uniref:Uncharacterized protein n=1 Tax=marine sediment metagenome TaxID=412755 RepID=A0A0F9MFD4_9ZZZZ|nr:hypothetical protein [archaeon]
MVRTLNFNLVKDAIENAKRSNNLEMLDHYGHILSEILRNTRLMITNSIIPSHSYYELLTKVKELYVLAISVQN